MFVYGGIEKSWNSDWYGVGNNVCIDSGIIFGLFDGDVYFYFVVSLIFMYICFYFNYCGYCVINWDDYL